MLDLSEGSAELTEIGNVFKRDAWRENEARLVNNVHDNPCLQPFSRCELYALAFASETAFCFQIEAAIATFQAEDCAALQFPPMIPFHRRVIADCALRHSLEPLSLGPPGKKYVVIVKVKEDATTPLLSYADAIPTTLPLEKLHAAVGYKKVEGGDEASMEFSAISGQLMQCKNMRDCKEWKPYFEESQAGQDRADWARLVAQTVRKGVAVATHSHIVEVRLPRASEDTLAELKRFLGPFSVRWLRGSEQSGVGVVVYPSVPAANNCLDRYEHEDDEGPDATRSRLPFKLYPFAPHVFGAYAEEQRRGGYGQQGGSAASSLGCSPSSVGGSWRDGASAMDRHVGGSRWGAGATPPLVPKESSGGSPPLRGMGGAPWAGRGTPMGLSPSAQPYRSPGSGAQQGRKSPDMAPLSLGKGKWLEAKSGGNRSQGADEGATVAMPIKAKMDVVSS